MVRGTDRQIPYTRLASVYDRIYAWKDYRREARSIERIVRRWGPPRARTVLDVACGTGAHLAALSPRFDRTGVDAQPEMLAVARARLPRSHFVLAEMPSFDLGRTFDVVTCLFSAIGYVRTRSALERTIATFARHLSPQGIVLVEPWLTPGVWRTGLVRLLVVPDSKEPLARMSEHRTVRGESAITMHYLAGTEGRVDRWTEEHRMGLFSGPTMVRAFRSAGLHVRRIASGFYRDRQADRGLYVARRAPFRRG